jgi:hypothetical protein
MAFMKQILQRNYILVGVFFYIIIYYMKRMVSYIFVGIISIIVIILIGSYYYKQTPKKMEHYGDYLDASGGGSSKTEQVEWIKFLDANRANGNRYNSHRRWAMFNSNFRDTVDVGHDVIKTWVPNITWYFTGADKVSDLVRAARGLPPMYRSVPKINYDINDINKGYSFRAFT